MNQLNSLPDGWFCKEQDNGKVKISHYCAGKVKEAGVNATALNSWFNPIKDNKCMACGTPIPETLAFMVTLKNDSGL